MMRLTQLALLLVVVWGCAEESASYNGPMMTELPCPAGESAQPNLFVMDDGRPLLSWVGFLDDTTDALMFSIYDEGEWSNPKTAAQGGNWFVNWADFPSMAVFSGSSEAMAGHWLQKSDKGTFDYDVRIAQSNDGGQAWNESFIIHRDSIAAEHGFVTMIPVSKDKLFATWLDGRNTKGEDVTADDHGHHGAMTIRGAQFDRKGNLYNEVELDAKTCDCCQTDAAMTSQGIVVVYRDRTDDEIRDIYIVREQADGWTEPVAVHNDGWKIAGCPVNGPAIAAHEDFVALAWHSEANSEPKVQLVYSRDAGATFSNPIRIDNGSPMGRVDVSILSDGSTYVTWLENEEKGAVVLGAHVDANRAILNKTTLVKSDAARRSGFPILESTKYGLMMAWTDAGSTSTKVRTGLIPFKRLNLGD
jgi:hypothetical protein